MVLPPRPLRRSELSHPVTAVIPLPAAPQLVLSHPAVPLPCRIPIPTAFPLPHPPLRSPPGSTVVQVCLRPTMPAPHTGVIPHLLTEGTINGLRLPHLLTTPPRTPYPPAVRAPLTQPHPLPTIINSQRPPPFQWPLLPPLCLENPARRRLTITIPLGWQARWAVPYKVAVVVPTRTTSPMGLETWVTPAL